MADLAITASEVEPGLAAKTDTGNAGATLTAGQSVFRDADDLNRIKLADNGEREKAAAVGVTLHAALADQPIKFQRGGTLKLGASAAPAIGVIYVVGSTPGSIAPVADLAVHEFCTMLGVGDGVDSIVMPPEWPFVSGQVRPGFKTGSEFVPAAGPPLTVVVFNVENMPNSEWTLDDIELVGQASLTVQSKLSPDQVQATIPIATPIALYTVRITFNGGQTFDSVGTFSVTA